MRASIARDPRRLTTLTRDSSICRALPPVERRRPRGVSVFAECRHVSGAARPQKRRRRFTPALARGFVCCRRTFPTPMRRHVACIGSHRSGPTFASGKRRAGARRLLPILSAANLLAADHVLSFDRNSGSSNTVLRPARRLRARVTCRAVVA